MSLPALGVIYAITGGVLAVAMRALGRASAVDALLVLGVWPMYAPFLWLGGAGRPADARADALDAVLTRATRTPLAGAVPTPAAARALGDALRAAGRRAQELDAVLARPDMAPDAARAPAATTSVRGAHAARLAAIRALADQRDRYAAALDEVAELTAQLDAQLALVSVHPALAPAAVELVYALVGRIDELAELAELVEPADDDDDRPATAPAPACLGPWE